jgi:translocation and assembly module TamA
MYGRALALVCAALTACGGAARRRDGDEYLKSIQIEGNKQMRDRTLLAGLGLRRVQRAGRAPDPYLVQVDGERIRGTYLRAGYLGIDVRSRVERTGDAATVIYTVEEGARARTRVVITGLPESDPDVTLAAVRAQLPLTDGAPFDYAVYTQAKEALLRVVEDAGYAHAALDATVYADRAHAEAIVKLDYTAGPKCRFGPVEISGASGELADAVRARLQFEPGDRYSTTALGETQRALYGLARFSTVQVLPDTGDKGDPVVRVRISLSEGARRSVELGGGFGLDPTAFEVRGRAGYSIAGWPFPLDTASLDLRPAYAILRDGSGYEPRIRALAKLERQDLFWPYAKGSIEGGYNYLAVEAFTSYGPRAGLGFSTPLGTERLQLRVGWGLERLEFRQISPLLDEGLRTRLGLDDAQRIGAYTQTLVVDLRDHPIEPRLGAYGEVRIAEGTRYAGGDGSFLQVVPELRGFAPAGAVTLAARVRAGVVRGDVPATERLFSGGGTGHRGFGERRLAPTVVGVVDDDFREVPYGGTAMLEVGAEARIPLTSWRGIGIGSVVFLDGGDVTETLGALDPMDLHWAIGTGLRFMTVVGPVRADLGYRLNRTGPGEPAPGARFAFHLSLGEAF